VKLTAKNKVSFSEASRDFAKVAQLADELGPIVILKKGAPKYALLDYDLYRKNAVAEEKTLKKAVDRVLTERVKAFEELAK
jgi:PHD/YefM family antitoxin component YafN of YafNO toxin-antitoxin module